MVRKYIYHLGQLTDIDYLPKAHFRRFLGHHSLNLDDEIY